MSPHNFVGVDTHFVGVDLLVFVGVDSCFLVWVENPPVCCLPFSWPDLRFVGVDTNFVGVDFLLVCGG